MAHTHTTDYYTQFHLWKRPTLTGTAQALFVHPPDEVATQVTPGGLSVAAGMEVMAFSCLLNQLWVLERVSQEPDNPHTVPKLWEFSWAYSQGIDPL